MTYVEERRDFVVGASRSAWAGLAVLMLPVLLVSMDVSVLNLAMPRMTVELVPTAAQQLWILDIYGFLIAGLLITMGNLGDRIGRLRILLVGATVFGAASALAAFAPNPQVLIGARALMGIGGASLLPSSLALISTLFADERERVKAIGIWTSGFAGGAVLGPILGGLLLREFWWGSVFLINIPVLMILLAAGPVLLPEHRGAGRDPLDPLSAVLSVAGILPVIFAIKQAAVHGPDLRTIAIGLLGALLSYGFLRRQQRLTDPLLDLSLFTDRRFSIAIGAGLVSMMSMAALSYLCGIYLQSVAHQEPMTTAVLGIPMAITVFVFAVAAPAITARIGVRAAFVSSLVISAMGDLLLLRTGVEVGVLAYLVGSAVAGIGFGIASTLVSQISIGTVPEARAGAAGAISETSFELGNAFGFALLGSLAALVFRSGGSYRATLDETIGHAAGDSQLIEAARRSFVAGLHVVASTGAGMMLAAAVVVAVALRFSGAARTSAQRSS